MDTSACREQQGNNNYVAHHAIDQPQALTTGSSSMAAQQEEEELSTCQTCIGCCVLLLIVGFITLFILLGTAKHPVYSVTVTGVAGLDDLALAAVNPSLSPVFNLTVRIDNAGDRFQSACIGRLSTVSVSYGDAVLAGRGSVPQFCAKGGKVRERGARAWGKDVDLPQFLRDQLAGELAGELAAGEAAVNVKVTTLAEHYKDRDTVLVCSQAKIGGGAATCRKEAVYHEQQPNPGSSD